MDLACNQGAWPALSKALGKAPAWYRAYNPPSAGVPETWPGKAAGPVPPGAGPLISIRPNPSVVVNGLLDNELGSFFAKVPEGAWVTLWHEGERANLGFSREQVTGMHQRAYSLFSQMAPLSARYGQCFTTYTATPASGHYPLTHWVTPGLDFYAMDGYGGPLSTAESVFGPAIEQIGTGTGPLAIWESNHSDPAARPDWFRQCARLAADRSMPFLGVYFGAPPYAWDSTDTATIGALREIQAG